MTIILFLIDTSSSMCQKAYVNGVQKSYLDIAKGAVETFLKCRQRTQDCYGDRYMLLTFEEPPANIKAGWKENHATFMNELKNLQSTGLTSMGESLKNAFDLLNLNRMQSGIDTYGQGRCPFYLEPSIIIVITDGGRYSYRNGVHQDIILPLNLHIPGTKFTKEPFRWDQRLFSLVLRMSGNKIDERSEAKVPHDDSPIERMCEVTGGRSYHVRSQYVLNQCIESLVLHKLQPGVVLQFEPFIAKDPNTIQNEALQDLMFQPLKKMIYVQKISQKTFPLGFWPLPEPYWPDPKAVSLPPRDAHPKLKVVTPAVDEPQMVHNFPIDKYEIEASPLTLQILQKRELKKCWQVIISNGMHGFELPFGYLKASATSSQVHLYVLAYNYPALLPLLHDLIHKYNMSPPTDLMYKFNSYVRSIPPYYCPFLRKALLTINVPYQLLQFLLPDSVDNYLSPNIANQLKQLKNTAKQEQENLCMKVYKQLKQPKPPYRQIETAKLNPGVPLRRDLVRHPLLRDTFAKLHADIEPLENYTIVVPQLTRQASAKSYRNPFDIPRRDIMEEIGRMRESFFKPQPVSLVAKDSGHCLPIAEMGNYQEYLKNKDNPLREIEPTNVRQHMFGNPYKKDKRMVMVDEAELSEVAPIKGNNGGSGSGGGPGGSIGPTGLTKKVDLFRRKRKAGALPMDYVFRRTSTDSRPSTPTPTSNAPSAGSSSISLSDLDSDDNASDTSSTSSAMSENGTSDPLVMAFPDFIDEETSDNYFPLNGYVRDFINGVGADNNCDNGIGEITNGSTSTFGGGLTSTALQSPTSISNGIVTPICSSHAHVALSSPVASIPQPHAAAYSGNFHSMFTNEAPASGISSSAATGIGIVNHHSLTAQPQTHQQPLNGGIYTINQPLGVVGGNLLNNNSNASLPAAHSYHHYPAHSQHNDINDAQEISRILQQCHNGNTTNNIASSSSASSSSILQESVTSVQAVTVPELMKIDSETILMPPPPSMNAFNTANNNTVSSHNFDTLKRECYNNINNSGGVIINNNNINNNSNNINNNNNNHQQHQHQHHNHRNQLTNHITNNNRYGVQQQQQQQQQLRQQSLTDEQREQARKHNLDLRAQVFRDIRRPGRNYTQLLEHLNLVKGDLDMKSNFIQMCISESLRFRRKQMVNSIQEWWEKKQQQLQVRS